MRVESGLVEAAQRGHRDPDWPHHERRSTSSTVEVHFDPTFEGMPSVVVGLSKVEWDQQGHKLVEVRAEDVTAEGFTLVIESGPNTRLAAVTAFWIAYEGRAWRRTIKSGEDD